jgi:hypothetical protein
MGQNYVTFGGQETLILGENKTILGTNTGDFLGQEKLILGQNESSLEQNKLSYWDRRSRNWDILRQNLRQN